MLEKGGGLGRTAGEKLDRHRKGAAKTSEGSPASRRRARTPRPSPRQGPACERLEATPGPRRRPRAARGRPQPRAAAPLPTCVPSSGTSTKTRPPSCSSLASNRGNW
jgi:hypothetical protein